MIIGISGKIKSGKDTVKEIINKANNGWIYKEVRFADGVKRCAGIILNVTPSHFNDQSFKSSKIKDKVSESDYYEENWDDILVRDLLIGIGNGLRENIHPYIWTNMTFRNYYPECNWIIPDVRYINEADTIIKHGGFIIRVNRKDCQYIDNEGETQLDNYKNFKYIIDNNYTLEHLENQVIQILKDESSIN